jgi:predicted nucleic acid-binding protein
MLRHPDVMLTPFHRAELTHAIFQQVFRGRMSPADAQLAYDDFEEDCALGVWIPVSLPSTAMIKCIELGRRYAGILGVRTLDSLHVAVALELKADRFWTFDERQRQIAEAEGLATS